MNAPSRRPVSEWRVHGRLIPVSMLGVAFGQIHFQTAGLFIKPLADTLGWSRSEISSGLIFNSVVSVCFAFFVGMLVDRVGPRRVALFGSIGYFCCFALLGTIGHALWAWWGLWIMLATSSLFVKPSIWASATASQFSGRNMGLALSIVLSGAGLSLAVSPPLTNFMINHIGWRLAYGAVAGSWAIVTLPLAYLYFYGAKDEARRLQQRGTAPGMAKVAPALYGLTLGQTFRSRHFWQLFPATMLVSLVVMGLTVHLVPALTDMGLSRTQAATAAGFAGLSAIVGRLISGILLDRIHGPIVAAPMFAIPALACAILLLHIGTFPAAVLVACLIGLATGGETAVAGYLITRYFGSRHFAALFSLLIGLVTIGTGTGPFIAGMVFDHFGSYVPFLRWSIPACIVAGMLIVTLGRYPRLEQ